MSKQNGEQQMNDSADDTQMVDQVDHEGSQLEQPVDDVAQAQLAMEAKDQQDQGRDGDDDSAANSGSGAGNEDGEDAQAQKSDQVETLEEEGEYAADYLEELLDIADIGGDIDMDVENGRASVAIVGEGADKMDLQRLVGRDGQVLEALQELTRLAVQQKTGQRSRLMLDIGDYRADRKRELTAIAEEAITKVKATGEPVKLDAMNPFERKVCHDVAAAAGCFSESDGQSPYRHVIISLPEDDIDDDDQ